MSTAKRIIVSIAGTMALAGTAIAADAPGEAAYRFYCYQCHGYSGDAATLASVYLDPNPRDFTAFSAETLPADRMIDAITNGRPGTAMVSFSSVLGDDEIRDVVTYINESFMSGSPVIEKYHSIENGWVDHEHYASAFPFVEGTLPLGTPAEHLDADQQRGRQLYLSACISCHDQANNADQELVFELRAVSYPRDHYSHRRPPLDFVSGASPYAVHDVPVVPANMSARHARGLDLYQENCAFCHAADGTSRNWIGSFLEPRPRDFTAADFALLGTPLALRELIRGGIPGTSMPAWRDVLTDEQIDDIIAYMQAAFGAEP